jgi:hypothetical protein
MLYNFFLNVYIAMSEKIDDVIADKDDEPGGFHGAFKALGKSVNFTLLFVIFILYIALHSTWWVEHVMAKRGLVENGHLSAKGELLNGAIISIAALLTDLLVRGGIL